ncbi:hypothetical protein LCGC14_2854010 [marine sediment metagenome]|uniref:Uncharacterized protein n=1 Tax=marine sediment metagenome TaxID=412755 RepID=A0A0F8Y7K4_9ZZZZ
MTIVANTFDMRTIPSAGKEWHVSLQSEDLRGCEAIKAAESGHSHYITKLAIRNDKTSLMDVSIGSGGDEGGTSELEKMLMEEEADGVSDEDAGAAHPGSAADADLINELKAEVEELKKQYQAIKSEISKIKEQIRPVLKLMKKKKKAK